MDRFYSWILPIRMGRIDGIVLRLDEKKEPEEVRFYILAVDGHWLDITDDLV